MLGTLYLIPNVLGDLREIDDSVLVQTLPSAAPEIAARLEYFVAENAKTTRAFLKRIASLHPLSKPIQEIQINELNVHTDANLLPTLLGPLLAGKDAGLISEAGVPAVADPGANLVRLAHTKGIQVKPLVGPSSILLAVMAGGLNGQSFAFNGYLPIDNEKRIKQIKFLEDRSRKEKQTQLFIETPYRNLNLLETLVDTCRPDTLVSVATDLTLATESIQTRSAERWRNEMRHGKRPELHKRPTVFSFLAN